MPCSPILCNSIKCVLDTPSQGGRAIELEGSMCLFCWPVDQNKKQHGTQKLRRKSVSFLVWVWEPHPAVQCSGLYPDSVLQGHSWQGSGDSLQFLV